MEYLVISKMQVQQIPSDKYPDRNLLLEFGFFHSYEGNSTWEDLTQTFCITLPKNVKVKATKDATLPFAPTNIKTSYIQLSNTTGADSNLGGFDSPPAFMRGDMVKFNVGYRAMLTSGETTYKTGENGIPDLFNGFISAVSPKFPFTLECEDNMWLLKQMPTPAKSWGKMKLQDIAAQVIADSQSLPIIKRYAPYIKLSVSDFSLQDLKFNVGNFTTTRGSLASMLARIKSQYNIDSYFRGNELRIGYLHYVPADVTRPYPVFTFQKNILDEGNNLKWKRKDDAVLSMIVRSHYLKEADGTTLDGQHKTTHAGTEILIYNNAGTFTYITKKKGEDFPTKYLNDIGQRFCMNIQDAITDPQKLFEIGKAQLAKYYYDGFQGCFMTFGIPYIKHGDTIQLVNKALPEQTGYYKVKAVNHSGSTDKGLRQIITIDYKV